MAESLIGKKLRFVLSNNFHYTGKVIDEDDRTITIIDQKGSRVNLSRFSIIIQEESQ
jgi:RNase P/RNase MRP subunit p29